jgi:hypothetical protein
MIEYDARSTNSRDETVNGDDSGAAGIEDESTEIDFNEEDDEGMEMMKFKDNVCSVCGEEEFSPDEWCSFYFCLAVPGHYQELLEGLA